MQENMGVIKVSTDSDSYREIQLYLYALAVRSLEAPVGLSGGEANGDDQLALQRIAAGNALPPISRS